MEFFPSYPCLEESTWTPFRTLMSNRIREHNVRIGELVLYREVSEGLTGPLNSATLADLVHSTNWRRIYIPLALEHA